MREAIHKENPRQITDFLRAVIDRKGLWNFSIPEMGTDWAICAFGVGIIIYFALPIEPSFGWAIAGLIVSASASIGLRRAPLLRFLAVLALCIAIGLFRATWHTESADAPILPIEERYYEVTGWVSDVEKSGTRERWIVRVNAIEDLSPGQTPHKVRVRIDTSDFHVGDQVTFGARLRAPPAPVVPGAYNSARAAYFKQIGAYGFAVTKPHETQFTTQGRLELFQIKLAQTRHGLARRILNAAPANTAGLQVALLTGIRTYIPEHQTIALRTAGLAHILAISGLHMGLISGGAYFTATLLLAMIIPLSRAYDVRKPAAIIGIAVATGYLILSGASVATQRAFIMTVIVFLAVILDRRAFSLRSVAIAALITLSIHPEAILSPGFHMSFAAVTALVVTYREWDRRRTNFRPQTMLGRFNLGFKSLAVTSIVAGAATGVFAAFHFNRVARYGLLGNLLAMPIFTFWVMPIALVVYIALPFGLERFPLAAMGLGIEFILWISTKVSNLPGSLDFMRQASIGTLMIFVLGFMTLCLSRQSRGQITALAVIMASFVLWARSPIPDLRISQKADAAIWADNDKSLYVVNKRRDGFGRMVFAEQSGRPVFDLKPINENGNGHCDGQGCRMTVKSKVISIAHSPETVSEDCKASDLVIFSSDRPAGMVTRRYCGAALIDLQSLSHSGPLNIYITKNGIRMDPVFKPSLVNRPWGRAYGYQ